MMPAVWVHQVHGKDPAWAYRRTYSSKAGALRTLVANGGMVALWTELAAGMPLVATQAPQRGDVGVFQARVHGGRLASVGGVCLGGLCWATVAAGGGLHAQTCAPLAAWSLL